MAANQLRIGAEDIGAAQGQNVRAMGKLLPFAGPPAQLQLAGEGPPLAVTGHGLDEKLSQGGDVPVNKGYFEAIGMLQAGSLQMMQMVYMGENVDMGMYAQMLALTKQVPDLF